MWVYFLLWRNTSGCLSLQLFRRVAAALPGMDTTQDKSREESILCVRVSVRGSLMLCHMDSPCQRENVAQHCDRQMLFNLCVSFWFILPVRTRIVLQQREILTAAVRTVPHSLLSIFWHSNSKSTFECCAACEVLLFRVFNLLTWYPCTVTDTD